MPYMLISTQIRMEVGPTFVGDGDSDPQLMELLQAKPSKQLGNEFKVKTTTLVKIAAGGFLAGSTGLYLAQKVVQRRVRSLPHYGESLRIVAEHDEAKQALGPPIMVGTVDLADRRHNYVGKNKSMLRIPVTGSLTCGHLDVMALRSDEKDEFTTSKVRLFLQDNSVIIYDNGQWDDSSSEYKTDE
uniref:GTP cyclohydrolase 1 feedback regulatory protein n=1 Tax=Heterorhabditis bacteriophora TaxID=37862 RepID=A0A1I7WMT8_HETBA